MFQPMSNMARPISGSSERTPAEEGRDLYEVLNLGLLPAKCVAGPKELEGNMDGLTITRVATKHPER